MRQFFLLLQETVEHQSSTVEASETVNGTNETGNSERYSLCNIVLTFLASNDVALSTFMLDNCLVNRICTLCTPARLTHILTNIHLMLLTK